MILPDREIIRLCEAGMITPFERDLVQSASLNIRLGRKALLLIDRDRYFLEKFNGNAVTRDRYGNHFLACDLQQGLTVERHQCVLVDSIERFSIPPTICGELELTSSAARQFWQHMMARHLPPGWSGLLTMELCNFAIEPKTIVTGDILAQVVFKTLDSVPNRLYSGKYNDSEVKPCK